LTAVVVNDFVRQAYPLGLIFELAVNFAALFFTCMVCHGELGPVEARSATSDGNII